MTNLSIRVCFILSETLYFGNSSQKRVYVYDVNQKSYSNYSYLRDRIHREYRGKMISNRVLHLLHCHGETVYVFLNSKHLCDKIDLVFTFKRMDKPAILEPVTFQAQERIPQRFSRRFFPFRNIKHNNSPFIIPDPRNRYRDILCLIPSKPFSPCLSHF